MQKIIPHLWFDKEAKEAAEFYTTTFPNSSIKSFVQLHDTPSGSVDVVNIEVMGFEIDMISAGPAFKVNPSVSFMVGCKTKEEVDGLWAKLTQGGKVLMELGSYPFSDRYGWVEDTFGVSWQVMLAGDQASDQGIIPTMMFVGDQLGKAESAIKFYTSIFHEAEVKTVVRYEQGEEPDQPGTVKYADFELEGQVFAAMDSARMHDFSFTEAISFIVRCESQEEIDYYWEKLSAVPEAEQCGWLKDKYGFSWQIEPAVLGKMMTDKDPTKVARVTQAFLQMKKFYIAALEAAYQGS